MGLFQLEVFCDPMNSSQAAVRNDRLTLTCTIGLKNYFSALPPHQMGLPLTALSALCGSPAVPCRHSEWNICFFPSCRLLLVYGPSEVFNWHTDPSWRSLLAVYSLFQKKYYLHIHVRSSQGSCYFLLRYKC